VFLFSKLALQVKFVVLPDVRLLLMPFLEEADALETKIDFFNYILC
jgi:hypothetical protein